jgi:hypothetical protein
MPLFDAYVMVDWSASDRRRREKKITHWRPDLVFSAVAACPVSVELIGS